MALPASQPPVISALATRCQLALKDLPCPPAARHTVSATTCEQDAAANVDQLTQEMAKSIVLGLSDLAGQGEPIVAEAAPSQEPPVMASGSVATHLEPYMGCGTYHCFPSQQGQSRAKAMWSAQVWALAAGSTITDSKSSKVQVYILCEGNPYGPTFAVQQALVSVPWSCFGIKALSAIASTEQGTGQLELQAPDGSRALHALVLNFTAHKNTDEGQLLPASSALASNRAGRAEGGASASGDTAPAQPEADPEPAGRSRKAQPKPLQPPHRLVHRLVKGAVTAAMRELKSSSQGKFGSALVESKVLSLLPKVASCLLDIIRSAHSPVLMPFTCSTLDCTPEALPDVLAASLRAGCMHWSDAKLAKRLAKHTSSVTASETTQSCDDNDPDLTHTYDGDDDGELTQHGSLCAPVSQAAASVTDSQEPTQRPGTAQITFKEAHWSALGLPGAGGSAAQVGAAMVPGVRAVTARLPSASVELPPSQVTRQPQPHGALNATWGSQAALVGTQLRQQPCTWVAPSQADDPPDADGQVYGSMSKRQCRTDATQDWLF